jgi:hypothetical protein
LEKSVSELDIRQKAEAIARLFRARQPLDLLPADLMPASLDEAYAVQCAFEDVEGLGAAEIGAV